jgi:hypothetical protein
MGRKGHQLAELNPSNMTQLGGFCPKYADGDKVCAGLPWITEAFTMEVGNEQTPIR